MAVVFANAGTVLTGASGTTINIPVPASLVLNDMVLAFIYSEAASITPPAGFSQAPASPAFVTPTNPYRLHVCWKRQTSATGSGETTGNYAFTQSSAYRYG